MRFTYKLQISALALLFVAAILGCGEGGSSEKKSPELPKVEPSQPPSRIISNFTNSFDIIVNHDSSTEPTSLTLTNRSGVDLREVDLLLTLKNTQTKAVSQKTKVLSRWRIGEIVEVEGFKAGTWDLLDIGGDAKEGATIVKIYLTAKFKTKNSGQ